MVSIRNLKKMTPHLILVAVLWAATLFAYWNSFGVPFQFDDFDFVRNNQAIRHLDQLGAIWAFTSTRFLTFLTFALNYHVHGISVFGYHLVNFLIHLMAVTGVYSFALLFFRLDDGPVKDPIADYGAAFLVAVLFATHPLQTEAVTYISQRPASMMGCCYIWALTLYLASSVASASSEKSRARIFFCASLVFALMAMYSKQSAVTLPAAILLLELCRFGLDKASWKSKLTRSLPFFLVAALVPLTVFCFVDVEHRDNVAQYNLLPSYWLHAWTEIGVLKKYLALLLWPVGQNIDHDILLHRNFWDPEILFSLALHIALAVTAVRCRRKNAAISFGILFFYLALFVESFLVKLPDRMVEHRLYLPSVGIFLAFAGWARDLARQWAPALRESSRAKVVAWLSLALLALPLGVLTRARNEVWGNEETLWYDSVRKSPGKPRPLVNLSRIFYRQGRCQTALDALHVAVVNAPSYYTAHSLLGLCLVRVGRFDDAIPEFTQALSLSAELGTHYYGVREESYFGLAQAYAGKGDTERALINYRKSIESGPAYQAAAAQAIDNLIAKSRQTLTRTPARKP